MEFINKEFEIFDDNQIIDGIVSGIFLIFNDILTNFLWQSINKFIYFLFT